MSFQDCFSSKFILSTCLVLALGFVNGSVSLANPTSKPIILAQSDAVEIEFWQTVKDSDNALELQAYLDTWPAGQFAALARIRLEKLADTIATDSRHTLADGETAHPKAYRNDEKGYLGAQIISVTYEAKVANGLDDFMGIEILEVVPGMAADKAGMRPGDVVRSLANQQIKSVPEFVAAAQNIRPGATTTAVVVRNREQFELTITMGGAVTDLAHAAASGNMDAAVMLGRFYAMGAGHVEKDMERAVRLFTEAADNGHADASYQLGIVYDGGYGDGDENSRSRQAREAFARAAAAGHIGAIRALGAYNVNGRGGARDVLAAVANYEEAISAGDVAAKNNLAGLLERGADPVAKDFDRAVALYREAALGGSRPSRESLKRLGLDVYTPADIQRMLSDIGLYSGPIDGKIGRETKSIIRQFQRMIGVEPSGELSLELASRLFQTLHPQGKPTGARPVADNRSDDDWSELNKLE
ncbi:MAG: PDZ domain-containing protein [Fimbriimonadaceae bacterium]|nr:PDZ domain-containing protein [Alphaproteobacteria bacterium]